MVSKREKRLAEMQDAMRAEIPDACEIDNIKPRSKTVEYADLKAEIDYDARAMTITVKKTGDFITILADMYPQLQAIMADIGHQAPANNRR